MDIYFGSALMIFFSKFQTLCVRWIHIVIISVADSLHWLQKNSFEQLLLFFEKKKKKIIIIIFDESFEQYYFV
jgi:hypothetical protein